MRSTHQGQDRPDLEVRTRSGYYAAPPDATRGAAASANGAIESLLARSVPGGDLSLGLAAAQVPLPGKRTAAVVLTVGLRELLRGPSEALDLAIMALDSDCGDCRTLPFQRKPVTIHRPAGPSPPVGMSFGEILSRLDLPPGSYEIRVGASVDGRVGGVFAHVDVPDWRKDRLSASGLVFGLAGTIPDDQRDILAGVLPIVPTIVREFRRPTSVTALVRLYQGGSGSLDAVRVNTTILDSAGTADLDRTVLVEPAAFRPNRSADYRLDLPVSALAPGLYWVKIEARLGHVSVSRDATFAVR